MVPTVLLLFDIDGTLLINAHVEHREALHEAIREVWGLTEIPNGHIEAAGRTDPAIARAILTLAGVDAKRIDDGLPEFRDAAYEAYARLCPPHLEDKVAPGVIQMLERLVADRSHIMSLVTGNLEPIARLKLTRADLSAYFPRGQGGFGSDHEDRAALPAVARHAAGGHHHPYPREKTVVIGDTPLDIQCAHADGVRCIAVTTGPYDEADLSDADAIVHRAADIPDALADMLTAAL
jgi:phosphoglycolate phosphatase-like HAD superfamily hydrolase